jgi:hypothetical protein
LADCSPSHYKSCMAAIGESRRLDSGFLKTHQRAAGKRSKAAAQVINYREAATDPMYGLLQPI